MSTLKSRLSASPRMLALTTRALSLLIAVTARAADPPQVTFDASQHGQVAIKVDGAQIALYVYADPDISRPYFAHLKAPGGVQVTRNYPPVARQDLADHPSFHPGLWMSFGDISGSDYWRNAAPTRHDEFVEQPTAGAGKGSFAVRNRYLSQNDPPQTVCEEVAHYALYNRPAGYLLAWDSTFSSDQEFAFGDQEEMGIGVRVATRIRAEHDGGGIIPAGNGTILDAEGRRNGKEVWGNSADWCDYSGTLDAKHVGVTLFCHPKNFRPSWFHARDYGLLEANPFGRQAFEKGAPSQVVVKPGESLRLRYGVLLHASPEGQAPDLSAAYEDYLKIASDEKP